MDEKPRLSVAIESYFNSKQQLEETKKYVDECNAEIKDLMNHMQINEFKTDNNITAKIVIQNRESFNEDLLLDLVKQSKVEGIVKTKEYVDMDALEDAIYNGRLDASILTPAKQHKEVVTLKVSQKK